MSQTERRRWMRIKVRPEKTYSELDPAALQAAIDVAEKLNKGYIHPPAISAAIETYLDTLDDETFFERQMTRINKLGTSVGLEKL